VRILTELRSTELLTLRCVFPPEVKLDGEKDKDLLDRLNKFAPLPTGKWQPGQVMTGAQFNFVSQQASDIEAATRARNKTLEDAEIADFEHASKLENCSIPGRQRWNLAKCFSKQQQ